MSSGPSKEELEMYWKNSRQYFDELAKYYQQSDPEYYKECILPFYSNPFHSASNTGKSGGGIKLVTVMVLLAVIGAGAAAFFVLLKNTDIDEPKVKEKTVESKDNRSSDNIGVEETETKSADDDAEGLSSEDNFIIGTKAISEKDYDKAEKHLKRIKPGQKYYKEAKQLLENIKFMKKYDKK